MNIDQLYKRKNELLEQINNLDVFRPGSVSKNFSKCGKQECWCSKEGAEGHPRYLWSKKIKGKTSSKHLRLGPEVEKYINETEEYKKFIKICEDLVEVSEQICDLLEIKQPESQEKLEALKKKLQKQLLKRRTKK